jgi:putative resolvase
MLISIGKASALLGVSISTMRLWEQQGKIKPFCRTKGSYRRYLVQELHEAIGILPESDERVVVAYSRVSSSDQRNDLKRQEDTLLKWEQRNKPQHFESISDLGSGLNFKKRGLRKLLSMILKGKVQRLVLCHQDRLLRFGNELIYILCEHFGVEVVLIEEREPDSAEIKLAKDVITIINVFNSRLYGLRSHEKRRARLSATS